MGASSCTAEERECFLAHSKQISWIFIASVFAMKEEESFFFLLRSAVLSGHENYTFCSPNSI